MTSGADTPQDISEMMEKLWGPRSDAASDEPRPPSEQLESIGETVVDTPTRVPDGGEPQLAELRADLATLRSDIEARLLTADDLAEVRADSRDEMLQQLRLVLEEAAKHADQQVGMLGDTLRRRLDDVAAQVERAAGADDVARIRQTVESWSTDRVSREEFDALRSELRDVVTRQMAAAQTQLQYSVGQLDAAIADARTQMTQRLEEMAHLVSTEATRAAERASAQGTSGLEAMQTELWDLKERVREVSKAVGALRQRFPAP